MIDRALAISHAATLRPAREAMPTILHAMELAASYGSDAMLTIALNGDNSVALLMVESSATRVADVSERLAADLDSAAAALRRDAERLRAGALSMDAAAAAGGEG